ncbi:MAG: M3 family oligoendopeptidase, partial [Desulfobulbales bacterium]
YAEHQLSQIEEKLLLERAPVGRGSWTTLFEKIMGHIKFGEKQRTEEEVLADLYNPDRMVRQQAALDLTEGLQSQLHILTHVFNTLLADKMITDRLRKYPGWIRSMNLGNELEDKTVEVLIEAVTARYDIPQRYYGIKQKMLGLDELLDYDRYAPVPHLPDKKISWAEGKTMVLDAFAQFSPRMAEIAGYFFDKKWIHAPVYEGKRGGAFAHPCVPEVHPYVLVNYTGNLRDVSTVAHELGHGVHQYLAAENGYYNSNTTLVLSETASVFAELLVFNSQLALLDRKEERNAFICQKLESIFATVFRQISMNRFEDKVHKARRDQGELKTEEVTDIWLRTQRQMFGDSVTLSQNYGIWWSYIPHFLHTPGYVYSYAFGELLVLALYARYKNEGGAFVPKYLDLLSAGGTQTPYMLLEPFDVNLDDPGFWNDGLKIIDEMLAMIE